MQRNVVARSHTDGTQLAGSWRAPTQDLARANSSVGARQVLSWCAPSGKLARQLPIWRAPKPCPASACSFLRPLAALTLTPLALFRPPALGVKQVRNRVLVQQALHLREGGLFDPHVDGHMALGAECRVQLHRRRLQVQHMLPMVGIGTTLCPPANCTHLRRGGHLLLQFPPLLFPPLLPPLPQGALTGERVLCRLAGGLRRLQLLAQQLVLRLQAENLRPLPCPPPPSPAACAACAASRGLLWGEGAWSP